MIEQVEAIYASHTKGQPVDVVQRKTLLVHCWRGGMRSSGVAWLLDLYGFKVYILAGVTSFSEDGFSTSLKRSIRLM